jgi:hypothetical protein
VTLPRFWVDGPGRPEADVTVAPRWLVVSAARRPAERGAEEQAAAPDHPERAKLGTRRVADCPAGLFAMPIPTPLKDIAVHIVQAEGVGPWEGRRLARRLMWRSLAHTLVDINPSVPYGVPA